MGNKTLIMSVIIGLIVSLHNTVFADDENWSRWNTPNDTASNGIDFSYASDCISSTNGECKYYLRWNNRYSTKVEMLYKIKYSTLSGISAKQGTIILKPGISETKDISVIGVGIEGVQVGIDSKGTRLLTSKAPVIYNTNNDDDEKERERELRRKQEEQARWERSVRDLERQKRESNNIASASTSYRSQQERDNQNSNDALKAGLQSFQNSINQGAATMNYANQVSADVNNQLRRQKEARERDARELQRQQNEAAARQQREAENRRVERQREQERIDRIAQEQQARAEREKLAKEAERKALAAQAKKEQLAREQQKKEQLAQNNASQYTLGTSGSYATVGTFKQGSSGIPGGATGGSTGPSGASGSGSSGSGGSNNSGGSSGSSTGAPAYCPPTVWDEMSSDGKRFYVYLLNTCPTERLKISSVDYWGNENVTCGTMAMPEIILAGAKASPLDCRKFGFDSDQPVYPKYKVIWKIIP